MATNLTTHEITAAELQLPFSSREEVNIALREDLSDATIDHGFEEPADDVEAAWREQIARPMADIDSGRVTTISAQEAETMTQDDVKLRV